MYSLETICHTHIKESKLLEVINIKSSAWNYPLEEQLQWIDENLSSSDIHCLLKVDNVSVAYLNLVDINLNFDGSLYKGYGIGNVCSMEKGKGYGSILMNKVNSYIKQHTRVGLLFCRNNLLSFYSRFGWSEIPWNQLEISVCLDGINVMTYNSPEKFNYCKYNGSSF